MGEGALVPVEPLEHLCTDRFDEHRRLGEVVCGVAGGHDHRYRAVARHVAVVEAERCRDRAGTQVVVHRERVAIDRIGCPGCVRALVERDPPEGFAAGSVAMEVPLRGLCQ